jgi:hypothetical protein
MFCRAADNEPLATVAIFQPGQQRDDAPDRPVLAGGEILAPQRAD